MTSRKILRSVIACGVSLSVMGQGAYSEACWLFQKKTVTNYAPVAVAAPACAPAPQVCNYQPQTCYRTVYVNTPVTTYQPVAGADPCTGCPTTCMRPVTTYVSQARMVPYTTYRPVFAPAPTCNTCNYSPVVTAVAAPACATGSCGQTVGYAPAVSYQPAVVRPGCSSCSAATYSPAPIGGLGIAPVTGAPTTGAVITSAPSLSSTTSYQPAPYQPAPYQPAPYQPAPYQPAPYQGQVGAATSTFQSAPVVQSAPVIQANPGLSPQTTFGTPGSTVPSLGNTIVGSPTSRPTEATQSVPASRLAPANSTFKDESQQDNTHQDDSHLKPIPDTAGENKKTNTTIPHTQFPDRTTALPIQKAWAFTPVAKSEPVNKVKPATESLDDSGWRSARR